jgi:hypothetical protein
MRLSKKGEYAVRALIEIGFESKSRPNSLIQISTVAQRTNIPEKFLEQILLALRNGGVLKSKRGVEGGYSLAKGSDDITLGEENPDCCSWGRYDASLIGGDGPRVTPNFSSKGTQRTQKRIPMSPRSQAQPGNEEVTNLAPHLSLVRSLPCAT